MENFNYEIKPYNKDDYNFVYNTKKVAYKNYVETNFGKWDENTQKNMFETFIKTYEKDIKIVMQNGKKIGFYHFEELNKDDLEIGNICIIPEFQGKGIGTKILKNIINQYKNKNIYLRYFKQNPVVNLYRRLGFEIIEEQQYHFKMVLKTKEKDK